MVATEFNWQVFGLVLAGELFFAMGLAWGVRVLSLTKLIGQTYWMVVVGVAGVVIISGPIIGLANVAILAACFTVAALPMGVEYFARLISEAKAAQAAREELVK